LEDEKDARISRHRLTLTIVKKSKKLAFCTINNKINCARQTNIYTNVYATHHAEGLVNPKVREPANAIVTIFGYPRACRFRKYQFENRSWELPLPTFFKM
jgi:hypothetical protein